MLPPRFFPVPSAPTYRQFAVESHSWTCMVVMSLKASYQELATTVCVDIRKTCEGLLREAKRTADPDIVAFG